MDVLTPDLRARIAAGELIAVREALAPVHPADIANEIGGLPAAEAATVLRFLPRMHQATVFRYFDAMFQIAMARRLPRIVAAMSHDERADLWKQLDHSQRMALLPALAQAEREEIRRLAAWPEGKAGSVMTSDDATLAPEMTAAKTIEHLRLEAPDAPDAETIYSAYVIDEDRKLISVVTLRELILRDERQSISDLMRTQFPLGRVDEPRALVAERIARYDLTALPVVTEAGRLVGIVTVDDALDIGREDAAGRLARFGGAGTLGGPDLDLRASPLGHIFRLRLFWLSILTVFGVITAGYIARQEAMLAEALILAAFIAPIIDMGDNTGSQSATLVIRAMALGQVVPRAADIWFVLKRELPVLAVIALTMLAVTVVGGLLGALLPFAARRFGTDPAAMSGLLITSVMDLLGVVLYFAIAWALLGPALGGGA